MSPPSTTPTEILLRMGELWLKGRNRRDFIDRLLHNLLETLRPRLPGVKIQPLYGRFQIRLADAQQMNDALDLVCNMPGIVSACPIIKVAPTYEAIEEAEYLTKFASTVHWVTQFDPRWDEVPHAVELRDHPNVKHWSATRLMEVVGDDAGVNGVVLKRKGGEEVESLSVEGCFIYVAGSKPITDFLSENAVELQDDGGVAVNDEMETSVPGVFAIGDIRNTPFKQVVVAAADGCIAAMSIDRFLKGRKKVRVDWVHDL